MYVPFSFDNPRQSQNHSRQFVCQRKVFENIDGGRRRLRRASPFQDRETELFEQHFRKLLGRSDVEFAARELVDLLHQTRELLFDALRLCEQRGDVDADAGALDVDEHRDQRQFERPVHVRELLALQLTGQKRCELSNQIGASRRRNPRPPRRAHPPARGL